MCIHTNFTFGFTRMCLFFSRKANKTFVLYVYFKGLDRCNDDINAQVEFEIIDQKWIINVLTNDVLTALFQIRESVSNENALAL